MNRTERSFEALLWNSRLIVLVAVIASLGVSLVMFYVATVDGYLLAAIMLIFAFGLYELFVSRIDIAEGSEFAERLLLVRSLDDLKDRLAKIVVLILVVKFFEYAITLQVNGALDLLWLALSIALVSVALVLSKGKASS